MSAAAAASSTAFTFPPLFNFKPFFTVQPTESTWAKQKSVWLELIRTYCAHHQIQRIGLQSYIATTASSSATSAASSTAAAAQKSSAGESRDSILLRGLFRNDTIDRQLSVDTIRLLLDALAGEGYGVWEDAVGAYPGAPLSAQRSVFFITSHLTFHALGDALLAHLDRIGESTSILTLYELAHGDSMKSCPPIYGLEEVLVWAVVKSLESRNKCRVIPGAILSETGVKFLG